MHFDSSLICKYDRPGPRYTSYPTVPNFKADFGAASYSGLLTESAGSARPLSLYVHLPFCQTLCFYCGCNVTVSHDRDRAKSYLGPLEREMGKAADLASAAQRPVVQVHWGGGTPTFLRPADLSGLMETIRQYFRLAEDCEVGVEVDPRECTPEHLDALAGAGINRLSLGLQDLDPQVQKAVNRIQSVDQTWAVVEGARQRGMTSLNVDLIYGLPSQTLQGFAATVEEVLSMSPDRLAVFNFAYLPELLRHHRVLDADALPDRKTKLALLEQTIDQLLAAGYVFIGMDHFAKPQDPLARALHDRTLTRNFQGYSTCGETDLLAFGVSSISHVAGGYAQNHKDLRAYSESLDGDQFATWRGLVPDPEDSLRRDVIMRLMCHFELPKAAVEERHEVDFDRHFAPELDALRGLADDGLVEVTADQVTITPLGRLLVRNVAMVFDAYLDSSPSTYSRTV